MLVTVPGIAHCVGADFLDRDIRETLALVNDSAVHYRYAASAVAKDSFDLKFARLQRLPLCRAAHATRLCWIIEWLRTRTGPRNCATQEK